MPAPRPIPQPLSGRKPKDAARDFCEDSGGIAFNVPGTSIPITLDLSTTLGPANYTTTNDLNFVVPLIPWPAWAAFGGSVDMTINAPSQVLYNPTAGLGKNLSVGYFYGPDGPQGISLSLGPSVGPPLNVSLPTPNTCTRLAN